MAEIPDPFLKNQSWAFLWTNSLNVYTFFFYRMTNWGLWKYIGTKLQAACFYLTFIKSSYKTRRGLKLVSLPHFLDDFWRKIFLFLYLISWQNFIFCLALLRGILGIMCITIIRLPGCDIISFSSLSFYMANNSRQNFKYLGNKKYF